MSLKSLLQFVLLLLIFLIVGIIYFLYFYSGSINQDQLVKNELSEIKNKNIEMNNVREQDVLEDAIFSEEKQVNIKQGEPQKLKKKENNNFENIEIKKGKNKGEDKVDNSLKNIENLTKEIEYITSNKNGDVFKISSKYGKTNLENSSILDLETVDGVISSAERPEIYITSDFAKYNYDNQNSKFYGNVIIKYDNKVITCDNLDLIMIDNIAVAYSNVIINDNKSTMKAQVVTLDIVTKDININSEDKVKIISN